MNLKRIIKEEVQRYFRLLKEGRVNSIGQENWYGGDTYRIHIDQDSFIHFTSLDNVEKILRDGKLNSGGNQHSSFAISTVWGEYTPNVQNSKINNPQAILFTTEEKPHGENFAEEVTWRGGVKFKDAKHISFEKAVEMIENAPEKLNDPDKDSVVYVNDEDMGASDPFDVLEEIVTEDYPASFDMDTFKSLSSFAKRVKYCEEHLQRISSGSSRIVYKIDDEKVLKLAKNKKGLAQNETEYAASQERFLDGIVAKIYDIDQNYRWIEMDLAKKVTRPIFKSIKGFDFNDMAKALHNFYYSNVDYNTRMHKFNIDEDALGKIEEDELYNDLCSFMHSYDAPVGDLIKTSSYGVIDDEIKLIDYGLTSDVYESYYS